MTRISSILAGSLLIAFVVHSAYGGPWPRKQGTGFVQLGASRIAYDKVYGDDGIKQLLGFEVTDNVVQVFAEYGVNDDITVTAMVPFKVVSVSAGAPESVLPGGQKSGIGDIDLAIRRTWLSSDGYVLSTEMMIGLATGDHVHPYGLILGDGETNIAVRLSGGRSFYPSPLYVSGDAAYNFRSDGFSDDVLYNLEIGYDVISNRLLLILLVSGRESTSMNPTPPTTASALGLLSFNQEYTAIIPKVLYKFSNEWGVSASFGTAVHGRNVAGGFVFAGGLFYEF